MAMIALGALAWPVDAQSLEIFGYAGELGEWELTAAVSESASQRSKEFSGPIKLTHVGICTQDGPEQRTGEMRFQISAWPSRLNATLSIDGVQCTYDGKFSDFYTGMMICPNRQAIPLKLWVK